MKPTYGRVSRYGLVAYASSLDQVGGFGQSVEDVAVLLETIAGHDRRDSTSLDLPVPPYSQSVNRPLANLRIGWVREHFGPGLDAEVESAVRTALDVYKSLGATLHEISLPHSKYAVATYYVIAPSEASSNLARYDGVHFGYRTDEKAMLADLAADRKRLESAGDKQGLEHLDSALVRMYRRSRAEGFGAEVKRRIMLGTYALSAGYYDAYYLKALKVRRLIRQDFDRAFEKVDLIAGPITPAPAFKIGQMSGDPLAMYLVDIYTVSANLAGIPGICPPCGQSKSGLPIGLQLQAPALEEDRLLRGARMYEQATEWHKNRAQL
jgi:aspartyl-tRNA(Asn)/glutamyl-tRNA(Gln) amidotransferase subunit A